MKQSKMSVLGLVVLVLTAGCSTIRFHSGETGDSRTTTQEWHHIAAFRLIEASAPVDMNDRCPGKGWSMVQTERSFLSGLAGLVDNIIIGVEVWEPLDVQYVCSS